MIDELYEQCDELYEQWDIAGQPMGSFQVFLFAEYQKSLAEVKRLREVQKKIDSLICDECGLSIEEHIRYHTENDVTGGCPFGDEEE